MRRETILAIWIGGFVLAAALYLVGPDRFLDVCLSFVDTMGAALRHAIEAIGVQSYGVIRALAIAIYVVFAVLAVLSSQRGRGGVGALFVVSVLFLILVWRPFDTYPTPLGRWIVAFVLVLSGAVVMTQRLGGPTQSSEVSPPPYHPGGRRP